MFVNKRSLILAFYILMIVSCNNNLKEIPFPENGTTKDQPVNKPLQFSVAKKINWPVKTVHFKPVIKRFSMNNLPVRIFDSTGFLPFSKPPSVVQFNLNNLPDTVFAYNKLPSQPLRYEISIAPKPKLMKVSPPHLVSEAAGVIYVFGDPFTNTPVSCLFKDNSGFIWIASGTGLYRYDGENLTLFMSGSFCTDIVFMRQDM